MILVQSGLLTDKSKQLRIASENIIKEESLSNKKIEVISSDVVDDNSFSKIIKIMIKMPTLAEGIKSIDEIKSNEYFWTTKDLKKLKILIISKYYLVTKYLNRGNYYVKNEGYLLG